jgi:hypothetical protein
MAFSLIGTVAGLAAFGYIQQDLPARQRVAAEAHIKLGMVVFLVSLIGATIAYTLAS